MKIRKSSSPRNNVDLSTDVLARHWAKHLGATREIAAVIEKVGDNVETVNNAEGHYFSAHSRLAGLTDEILICPDGQGRAREVGLPRHEHVFDAAGAAAAPVRGHTGPGDVRGARRLLAAADRKDLGVARGSRGVEELRRVALDDTSPGRGSDRAC
jgi:hypothetical protein